MGNSPVSSSTKQWGGRRIAGKGKKIGRPASQTPHIRKNIYLSIIEWAALAAIHPSPSHAIRNLIHKENKDK
jgi:hypothetical protein